MSGLLEMLVCVVVGVGAFVATKVSSVNVKMKRDGKDEISKSEGK